MTKAFRRGVEKWLDERTLSYVRENRHSRLNHDAKNLLISKVEMVGVGRSYCLITVCKGTH